jgi:hypothetical protein
LKKIKDFIQSEVLLPRLQESGVLVVYDPDRRYRDLCLELAGAKRRVVDACGSSIESREQALAAFQELGQRNSLFKELLIYVPAKVPVDDEERQGDPFSLYAACGSVFPKGDGDEYLSLCLKAKADQATEIRRIFSENSSPDFAVIDAVGSGTTWPSVQAALQVESARDILLALLAPSSVQIEALKMQDGWVTEVKDLCQRCLGMKLVSRAKTWSPIADELWRFVLFSELAFALPVPLPPLLANVPHAPAEARPLVEHICETLRADRRTQDVYVRNAEETEKTLSLVAACAGIRDLGLRDTFPFQERSFFSQAVAALKRDDVDKVREALDRHAESVWVGREENQAQWHFLKAGLVLLERCEAADRDLPAHSGTQDELIDFYVGSLREVDRAHREFEQATGDLLEAPAEMVEVGARARSSYRQVVGRIQDLFTRHLMKSGWPPVGRLANADVFDRLIAPKLQESGRRVAYVMIDALRYELGVELKKQLDEDGDVDIQAAFAQLPTVTPVGMASLLPGAGQSLRLMRKDDGMVAVLGDQPLASVNQRMDVLRKHYGQRFAEATLTDFIRGKLVLAATVELLVLRSNTMDNQLESNPEETLRLISDTLKRIRVATRKLTELGFRDAIVVTDHGFFLNTCAEAGHVCSKPPGAWVNLHERFLLGNGSDDSSNFVARAELVGIRGDFGQVAGPRALVAYRAGEVYFHGGASLQETVVPVISIRLQPATQKAPAPPKVTLDYKSGATRINTRLPVIRVTLESIDLFSMGSALEILLEAHDAGNNVVGEARPGGPVNPATRTIQIKQGESVPITLRMSAEFEGKFTLKALDPTTLATYQQLDLQTEYTV